METERYPDVTLGEHGPMNSVHGVETVVALRRSDRGCYLTRTRAVLIAALILIVVVAVVLIVLFFGGLPGYGCKCEHVTPTHQSHTPGSSRPPVTPTTPSGESPPWAGIRLPRDVVPRHYDLTLRVDLDNFVFSGAVNISLRAHKATRYVVLHRADLNVTEDAVRMREVPKTSGARSRDLAIQRQFEEPQNQFHVVVLEEELREGGSYVLQLGDFEGVIRMDLRGLYRSSYRDRNGNTRYLASSQLQSTDARRVFPCFDEPDFKATFRVTIIHQDGYVALNNMPVELSKQQEPGWQRREFMRTPVMSTYILAFVVSDFKYREAEIDNGYKLRIWSQPDSYEQTAHALDFGVKTYRFFTDYFNITDVVPKADHVAVPDFSAGAMENWGLVIYRETALLYDPDVSSSSNKYTVTLIVAHEIAHTWFGNMVTMKWWDDLWLNEGFASILMYLAMEHAYPEWNVFALQVVEEMFPVMLKDALVTSHPVSAEIRHPDDIQQVFSVISYNKGMAVLRMLQGFIGPEKFRNGLRIYVNRFKFGNAELDQLWQTFTEAVEGKVAIKQVMDTWTLQKGYPVVTVRGKGRSLRLDQHRFLFDPDSLDPDSANNTFRYEWYIPFTFTTEDDPSTTHMTWLNRGSEWIPKPRGWLLGNVDYMGFYRVNYETDMWRQLTQQLARNHSVFLQANRAGLIGDAFALARADLLEYDVAFNLTRYLKDELSYVPWRAFLDAIEFLRGMIATKPAYVTLQKYLRTLVAPVLEALGVEDKGALPERYLRRVILEVACDVGLDKAVQHAMRLFNDWKVNQTRLPPDQALLVYSVGVREGGQDVWDFIWNKAQHTPIPSEREMMMDALAQTEKPWLLWRYANWLFDSTKIRQQDVRVVVKHFTNNPLGRIIALEFLMSRWDELNDGFGTDLYLLREVIQEVTKFVNSDFHLKQLESLFREKTPKSASMAANNALALISSNIKWMSKHYDQIAKWLDKNVT